MKSGENAGVSTATLTEGVRDDKVECGDDEGTDGHGTCEGKEEEMGAKEEKGNDDGTSSPTRVSSSEVENIDNNNKKKRPSPSVNTNNIILNRSSHEVARDTKRILEICYGNNNSKKKNSTSSSTTASPTRTGTTTATIMASVDGSIELKRIELNPKPPPKKKKSITKKKKEQTGDGVTTTKIKKKKTSNGTSKTKSSKSDNSLNGTAEEIAMTDDDTDSSSNNNDNATKTSSTTKKKKRKKKTQIVTVTKTITNEDGTTSTVTVKKRKKRKKKRKVKPPIPRDAAGRIIRKRRKIKNRHRVVKKEFIKNGKDVKLDLPTIEESGMSSEEDDDDDASTSSSGSSSSDEDDDEYGFESGADSSQYTLETMYTYDSDDVDILDSDDDDIDEDLIEGRNGMMIVYEEEEGPNDDDDEENVDDKDKVLMTMNDPTDAANRDKEQPSSPPKDIEQPTSSAFQGVDNGGDYNNKKNCSSSDGFKGWLARQNRSRMIAYGLCLLVLIGVIIFVVVYFVVGINTKSTTPSRPTVAPTSVETTSAPTNAPTIESTTIFDTASTVCRLPNNDTEVLVLQAEDADMFVGSTFDTNETVGFCGEGYTTDFVEEGSGIYFDPITIDRTGFYRIAIRYSNGDGNEELPLRIAIDRQTVGFVTLPPTGNDTTWFIDGLDGVLIRTGNNHTLELWTVDERDASPNIDWISIRFQNPLTRFEYLTDLLSPLTDIATPSPTQVPALLWMSTEDPIDWKTLSDREIVERYSLVQLYGATEGDLWTTADLWLSETHVCDWYGVGCSEDFLVTDLILDDNGLYGSIPVDLHLLTNLVTISLKTNSLEGSLGSSIGRLVDLTSILLNANFLVGSIPKEIGILSKLSILDLGANGFGGTIPDSLFNLRSLKSLVLSTNDLDGPLPSAVGNLVGLEELNLQSNQLSRELVTELGYLTNLTSLLLGFNSFSGTLPTELGLLTNLLFLDLNSNQLTGTVPFEYNSLNGTVIDLYGNAIREPR